MQILLLPGRLVEAHLPNSSNTSETHVHYTSIWDLIECRCADTEIQGLGAVVLIGGTEAGFLHAQHLTRPDLL